MATPQTSISNFYLLFKNIYFLIDFSYAIRIMILKVETIQLKQKNTHTLNNIKGTLNMNAQYDESMLDQEALAKANSLSVVDQNEMRLDALFGNHVSKPNNHSHRQASRPSLRVVKQQEESQAMSEDFEIDLVGLDDVECASNSVIGGFSFGKTLTELKEHGGAPKKNTSRRGTGYLGRNGRNRKA